MKLPTGRATVVVVSEVLEALRERFVDPEVPPLAGLVAAGRVQHRGGAAIALDGFGGDDCEGLVWVNVLRMYRTNEFPGESSSSTPCGSSRAIHLQVGVARCVATIDDHGNFPSQDELESEALALIDDAARLDTALCKASRLLEDREVIAAYTLHSGEPIGPEGGLVSWVQTASYQLG